MTLRTWYVAAAVVASATVAHAQEPGTVPAPAGATVPQSSLHAIDARRTYEGPPLSLQAALSEALERNPELAALRKQYEVARQRPAQHLSLAPPRFEAQIWQWPLNTLNPADTNMYMFMVNQDLPGRGKRQLRAAVAEKDVQLAETEIAMRARDVLEAVKKGYAELFVTRKAIDVHLASANLLRQFADVSGIKYETGRISQQDVLKAVVELSRLHQSLITLDEQAQLGLATLNTLLARDPGAPIGPLGDPRPGVAMPAVEELQRLALAQQPELQAARLSVERATADLAVVSREYKPDFFVSGGYMLMPRDRDAWTGTIGITWPTAPWARGKLDAQRAESTAAIEAARAQQRAAETRVRLAVQQAYVRVHAAQQRARLLQTTLIPQSEQTLEVSRVAYQADRVDFLALIENQRTLLDARLDYDRAMSELEQAVADLERAVGTDLTATAGAPEPATAVGIERTRR